mmetsp:Transcript_33640/g.82720  ORF Transcript_33640/g.82720 Transcript_33640/m.82720 type:complete len:242 (+) Transcript_33640:393-1118(+)
MAPHRGVCVCVCVCVCVSVCVCWCVEIVVGGGGGGEGAPRGARSWSCWMLLPHEVAGASAARVRRSSVRRHCGVGVELGPVPRNSGVLLRARRGEGSRRAGPLGLSSHRTCLSLPLSRVGGSCVPAGRVPGSRSGAPEGRRWGFCCAAGEEERSWRGVAPFREGPAAAGPPVGCLAPAGRLRGCLGEPRTKSHLLRRVCLPAPSLGGGPAGGPGPHWRSGRGLPRPGRRRGCPWEGCGSGL